MNITKNEKIAINNIGNLMHDMTIEYYESYSCCFLDDIKFDNKIARGILSSLISKKLVNYYDIEGENVYFLTQLGAKVFYTIGE